MNQPLVSIIMGVYNCEKTLDDAIQSILDQTYTNWEFIICDDGSADNTYAIAKGYADKYPEKFIVLKNETNMKLPATLNKCLYVASGEYIARMDGDDYSLPARFERQVAFLQENPEYDVVGTSAIIFNQMGDKGQHISEGEVNPKKLLNGVPFMHPTIMATTKAYGVLGGYSDSSLIRAARAEDYELWCRYFTAGFRGYNLSEPLFRYREDFSVDGKKSAKRIFAKIKLRHSCYKIMNVPKWKYIYLAKPIMSCILPSRLIFWYHRMSGKIK